MKLKEKFADKIEILPIHSFEKVFEQTSFQYKSSNMKIYNKIKNNFIRIVPKENYEGFFMCKLKKLTKLPIE